MIYYYGYAKVQENNPTGFFEYSTHAFENLALLNKFKQDSQSALDTVCQDDSYKATSSYFTTDVNKFEIWSTEENMNLNKPAFDYARE